MGEWLRRYAAAGQPWMDCIWPVRRLKPNMEDFDYNQIQQNQLHDVADDTMMPDGAENRADHDNENVVHIELFT